MTTTYATFTGIHGEHVSVHRSTESGDPRVWLVANRGGDNNGALHLTPEQAATVRDALDTFITDAARIEREAEASQTWDLGDPEPAGVVVYDKHNIIWYRMSDGSGWRHGSMTPYATLDWTDLLGRYGPLRVAVS